MQKPAANNLPEKKQFQGNNPAFKVNAKQNKYFIIIVLRRRRKLFRQKVSQKPPHAKFSYNF